MSEQKRTNPLILTWKVINTVGGVVGLVNFANDFYDWDPFFDQIIHVYRLIVHWPIRILPWSIPSFVADYLFFGLLSLSAFLKSPVSGFGHMKYFSFVLWPFHIYLSMIFLHDKRGILTLSERRSIGKKQWWRFTGIILSILFPDYDVAMHKFESMSDEDLREHNKIRKKASVGYFTWLGTVILLFLFCLIVSTIFLREV